MKIERNDANRWRRETPGGSEAWGRTPYADADRPKYFIVSADTHIGPPPSLFRDRVEPRFRDRVPRMERDRDGVLWTIMEGRAPTRIMETALDGEDLYRMRAGSSMHLESDSYDIAKRMADLDADGVDAEVVFPNGAALGAFWNSDVELMQAQFRVYNDWAAELSRPHRHRMNIAACIATGDVDSAVAEAQRCAKLGFRVVTLPNKPVYGSRDRSALNYNSSKMDSLWAALEDADLTVTFHVSTGDDPRVAKGAGGAVVNLAVHALSSTAEPCAHVLASGVLDRFPKLRIAVVEAGVGWIPWYLDALDEAYRKHHMWVFPKLKSGLPSDYFRAHGSATFGEDPAGLILAEPYGLIDNFCWANDYPHHEGTFPYSAQAIEREMGGLSETTRAKLLGLNAARVFRFDVPASLRSRMTP
jgi:predicted TIM-barrel fold metal-dependent hydrolase